MDGSGSSSPLVRSSRHPRSASGHYQAQARPAGSQFELYAWLFMRVSGIVLLLMALFHLWQMHIQTPIEDVNWAFVAARFTTPFWRIYDLIMLWLAVLHGLNGLRIVIDDYSRGGLRLLLLVLASLIGFIMLLVGSYTLVAFPGGPV